MCKGGIFVRAYVGEGYLLGQGRGIGLVYLLE